MKLMKAAKVDTSKRAGWVWKNWIPEGSPTTMFGDGGKGKSLAVLTIMRSIVTGTALPDGSLPGVTGNCLIISGEDSKEEITTRLNAMGGTSGSYGDIYVMDDEDVEDFSVPKKWNELQSAIKDSNVVFWAIDPIFNFVESKVRTINDASVRENIFTPMKRVMSRTNSTGLILSHMNKDRNGKTVSRASGSGAFVNAVRSTIAVMDTPGASTFLMGVPKTNRAGVVNPLEYSLHTNRAFEVVSIAFEGERPDMAHHFNGREAEHDTSQLGRAIKMFNELLGAGPMDSKPLRDLIVAATSLDTFNKAKKAVGAESKKVGTKWQTFFPIPLAVEHIPAKEAKPLKKLRRKPVENTAPARKAGLVKSTKAKKILAVYKEGRDTNTPVVHLLKSNVHILASKLPTNPLTLIRMQREGEFDVETMAVIKRYRASKRSKDSVSRVEATEPTTPDRTRRKGLKKPQDGSEGRRITQEEFDRMTKGH
jgi:hypothetical protein